MDYMLRDLLKYSKDEINNLKIQFNTHYGDDSTRFIDWWNTNFTEEQKEEGKCRESAFYALEKGKIHLRPGLNAIAFAQLPYSNKDWLLITAGEITEIKDGWADYNVNKSLQPLFGRLIITNEEKKGQMYTRNAKSILDSCIVKEVLPTLYSVGNTFPGYDEVCLNYSDLKQILSSQSVYRGALSKVKGVYCMIDRNTGKLYIGSAYGEYGVAQRWECYVNTKHGGNAKLIELYNEKGEEYFIENFQFSLLEFFPLSQTDEAIIRREKYWKNSLCSRKHGFNAN